VPALSLTRTALRVSAAGVADGEALALGPYEKSGATVIARVRIEE